MTSAAATRDPRFGRGALALAARCLDLTSPPPPPPTLDEAARGVQGAGPIARVALRGAALAGLDRDALATLPGASLVDGPHESIWHGPLAELTGLAREREALAPLAAAVEGFRAPLPTPRVMGIVNVTPDSFADGGRYLAPEAAVRHGLALVEDGAELLDVGGESTRPGAQPVSAAEELARVLPVVEGLVARSDVTVSVDTTKAEVAERALDAGASFVNDVSAGTLDPAMLPLVAARGVGYCAMHMLGTPRTMQADPRYDDPVAEIHEALRARVAAGVEAGVDPARIVVDPGIGFGKLVQHNVELLRRLGELRSLGLPLLLGVSNKSFLGRLTGVEVAAERTGATAAALTACVLNGASILRVHDVRTMVQAVRVATALRPPTPEPT